MLLFQQQFGNLQPATTYDITLTPIVAGRNDIPAKARVTTSVPAPRDLHVNEVTDNSAVVTWEQPHEDIQGKLSLLCSSAELCHLGAAL